MTFIVPLIQSYVRTLWERVVYYRWLIVPWAVIAVLLAIIVGLSMMDIELLILLQNDQPILAYVAVLAMIVGGLLYIVMSPYLGAPLLLAVMGIVLYGVQVMSGMGLPVWALILNLLTVFYLLFNHRLPSPYRVIGYVGSGLVLLIGYLFILREGSFSLLWTVLYAAPPLCASVRYRTPARLWAQAISTITLAFPMLIAFVISMLVSAPIESHHQQLNVAGETFYVKQTYERAFIDSLYVIQVYREVAPYLYQSILHQVTESYPDYALETAHIEQRGASLWLVIPSVDPQSVYEHELTWN